MTEAYQKFNLEDYEVVKNVTLPFLVMEVGTPYFIKFNTAIEPDKSTFSERVRRGRKPEDGKEAASIEPMHIAEVTNLMDGEVSRLVCHDVLENTLKEAYGNDAYVGRAFKIEKTKAAGKRYFNFNVRELQKKTATDSAPAAAKGAKK